MQTEQFYMMPKSLCMADGFVSKRTGDFISLTSSMKLVYMYMVSRNDFFVNKQAGSHYESQATVADACGLEYKAAGKILRTLLDNGILEGAKLRPNGEGQWRWFYHKVHKDIVLWKGNVKEPVIIDQILAKTPLKSTITPSPKLPYWLADNDDSGCDNGPF